MITRQSFFSPLCVLCAFVVLLPLFACGSKVPSGGISSAVWARSADSTTLDPAEVESVEDMKITQSLYETLIAFKDASTDLEGRLAKSWTLSHDGLTATFDLR